MLVSVSLRYSQTPFEKMQDSLVLKKNYGKKKKNKKKMMIKRNKTKYNIWYNIKVRLLSMSSTSKVLNKLYLLKPVASYSNCDLEKNNIFALARLHKDEGIIYCWVNNTNKKCYVGSSVNLTARLYKYYSIKNLYDNKSAINSALLKYGYSGFSLHILEFCLKSNAINREQYFIDLLKPEYNILKKAGSSLGYRHTEKTLKLLKENRIINEDTKKKLSIAASKRTLTEQERKKISVSRIGKKMLLDTRNKISESTTKLRGVAVRVVNKESGETQEYTTLTKTAEALKVSRTAISKCLLLGKPLKNKWDISYIGK